jgi:hypothetical protein
MAKEEEEREERQRGRESGGGREQVSQYGIFCRVWTYILLRFAASLLVAHNEKEMAWAMPGVVRVW